MKDMKNNNLAISLVGGVAGTCLMVAMAWANPSMLPEHPGHPMKELKDPVSGQSLANDPGEDILTGQKALDAAIEGENLRAPIQSRAVLGKENPNKVQNPQPSQEQSKEQSQEQSQ